MAKRTFQVAFYGAGKSGKTTTLRKLRDRLPNASAIRDVPEPVAVTGSKATAVFFDYQPPVERGLTATLRLRAYTGSREITSQAFMSLISCNALVFLYDAQPASRTANREAWRAAVAHVTTYNVDLDALPLVVQLTKCDRPKAVSAAEARRVLGLGPTVPFVETTPVKGKGLEELARAVERQVLDAFHDGRAAGRPTTKPSAKYRARAAAVASAADIAIACGPRSMAKFHAATKQMALSPELGSATMSSLASLETAFFTYWFEATGPTIDAFWKQVARQGLPFHRRDVIAEVLAAGRITNRGDYETVTDLIANAELSARDTDRLSQMIGAYERRR